MTLLKNAVILSLLTLVMTTSLLATLAVILGEQVKAHHDDVNTARNLTMIQSNLTKGN